MLDFLHPGYLFLTAAAALPILIHLFQRYRAQVVEFSSVALLQGVERRTIRWLRLRQLFLLLLRTLILLLIVLSLSRPIVTGILDSHITNHLPTAVVMAVDNSMSMGWTVEGRSLLDRSLERIREVIDLLHEGDRCALLYVPAPGARPLVIEGIEPILARLGEIHPLPVRLEVTDLMQEALVRLEEWGEAFREIHLHTDLQATAFALKGADEAPTAIDPSVHLALFTERPGEAENAAVTDLKLAEAPLAPTGGVLLEGEVVHRGPEDPGGRFIVRIRLDTGERFLREVNIGENGRGTFSFPLDFAAGNVRGFIEIDPDPLQLDNRRYFTLQLPGRPRVWFPPDAVGPSPLRTALRVLGGEIGSIDLEENFPSGPLGSRDIIVLESPSEADVAMLHPLVARGLGDASVLVVPPASQGGVIALNALLALLGLRDRYRDLAGSGEEEYVQIERWSSVTGETRRFIDAYAEPLTAVRFARYFSLHRGPVAPNGPFVETVDFHTDEPWLMFRQAEGGWRILLSAGFGNRWGNLYRSAIFVPLIDTLLRDVVARGGLTYRSFQPGDRVRIDVPDLVEGVGVELTLPDGERERVYPSDGILSRPIREGPGNVMLTVRGDDVGGYSVNPDGRESLLDEISEEGLIRVLGGRKSDIIRAGSDLEESVLVARSGRVIGRELLVLALLLLFVEAVVANLGSPEAGRKDA
jgi:hypothetical protein